MKPESKSRAFKGLWVKMRQREDTQIVELSGMKSYLDTPNRVVTVFIPGPNIMRNKEPLKYRSTGMQAGPIHSLLIS